MAIRIISLLLIVALVAQPPLTYAAKATSEESEEVESNASATLAPGYLIELRSPQDDKLSGTFRISPDSRVDLPYSVSLSTNGLTLGKLRTELEKSYRPYFKTSPEISVRIRQRRLWIDIRGLISKPGNYLVRSNSPLDEIISMAGGTADEGEEGYLRIQQDGQTFWVDLKDYYKHGKAVSLPTWKGGEKLFVQRDRPDTDVVTSDGDTPKVRILGEVRNPGEQLYRPSADGYDYLVQTGGPTSAADLDRIELVRRDAKSGGHESVIVGPLSSINQVKNGDLLIVHTLRPTAFDRALQTTSIVTGIVTALIVSYLAIRGTR